MVKIPTQHRNKNQECHINEQRNNKRNRINTRQKLIAIAVFKPRIIIT